MKKTSNFRDISDSFATIDFETANQELSSICSVGVVVVRDGIVADTFYSLIHPEPDYYLHWNSQVHGLTAEDTLHSPVFPKVWKEIEEIIEGLPLIAHNKAFDENCLKAVFKTYCMDYPDYDFHCTLQASRRLFKNLPNHKLHTVAEYCGFNLENHHHALADAEACAAIALEVLLHKDKING
ncbi:MULTISPECIES: 3'-5' exonuclease [unclassified Parabacteroides]|uniref:3'-5' exonuclease n=1 Tax=unclassified Parabacteroides TaxID=2649774 RepID=UPI00247695B9|nr:MULTISPECIES: 3'-5' exonuclease [unclassified Parabacteroides]